MEDSSDVQIATVTIDGVANFETSAALHSRVLAIPNSARQVIVDCANAERLDCSALQILLSLRKELQGRAATLQICDANESIRGFAEIAGLGSLFE